MKLDRMISSEIYDEVESEGVEPLTPIRVRLEPGDLLVLAAQLPDRQARFLQESFTRAYPKNRVILLPKGSTIAGVVESKGTLDENQS